MVSVVSSNPTGGNFLKFFKPLDVNFGLKCKCDLIVKTRMQQIGLTIQLIVQTSSARMFNTFCTLSQSKIYLFVSFNPSYPVCCIAGDQRVNGITTCVVGNNMSLVVLSLFRWYNTKLLFTSVCLFKGLGRQGKAWSRSSCPGEGGVTLLPPAAPPRRWVCSKMIRIWDRGRYCLIKTGCLVPSTFVQFLFDWTEGNLGLPFKTE